MDSTQRRVARLGQDLEQRQDTVDELRSSVEDLRSTLKALQSDQGELAAVSWLKRHRNARQPTHAPLGLQAFAELQEAAPQLHQIHEAVLHGSFVPLPQV